MNIKRSNTEYLPPRITWCYAREITRLYKIGAYECDNCENRTVFTHWLYGQLTYLYNRVCFIYDPKATFARLYGKIDEEFQS